MMLGVSSMDCAMVIEFRGDHSDTDPIDFFLTLLIFFNYSCMACKL